MLFTVNSSYQNFITSQASKIIDVLMFGLVLILNIMNETKICTNCKIERQITDFYYNSNSKRYECHCKECGRLRCKEWRKNYPEKSKLSDKTSKLKLKNEDPVKYRLIKLIASMKSRYPNKEIVKELTVEDAGELYKKQCGKCHYTGIQMKLTSDKYRDLFLMSIDRIDSSIGYTKDNIVLCCWGMNVLKGPHSENELIIALQSFYEGAKSIGKIK